MAEIRSDELSDANEPNEDLTSRGTPRKRKRRTTEDIPASREAGEVPVGVQAMARVFAHPLRVKILYAMNGPQRRRSASDLGELMGKDVKRLSYHMRELAAMGFIEQVDERQVRGALEKVYAPVKRLEAWDLEWSELPEAAKALLAANTLGLAVRALGAAIDSGDYRGGVDRVTPSGQVTTFWLGTIESSTPEFVIAGPGNSGLWFTDHGFDAESDEVIGAIGKVAPVGPIGTSPLPTVAIGSPGPTVWATATTTEGCVLATRRRDLRSADTTLVVEYPRHAASEASGCDYQYRSANTVTFTVTSPSVPSCDNARFFLYGPRQPLSRVVKSGNRPQASTFIACKWNVIRDSAKRGFNLVTCVGWSNMWREREHYGVMTTPQGRFAIQIERYGMPKR